MHDDPVADVITRLDVPAVPDVPALAGGSGSTLSATGSLVRSVTSRTRCSTALLTRWTRGSSRTRETNSSSCALRCSFDWLVQGVRRGFEDRPVIVSNAR